MSHEQAVAGIEMFNFVDLLFSSPGEEKLRGAPAERGGGEDGAELAP